jgi:hypothetical protein
MTLTPTRTNADPRWQFIRDVLVFQVKLLLDNVRDFALVPVSLGAAIIEAAMDRAIDQLHDETAKLGRKNHE